MATDEKRRFVAELAAQYGDRLRRFIKTRARNAADVPDLAQEVFMRLLRVQNYEEIRNPEAYLFTVASHIVYQHAQKHASMPESIDIIGMFAELQLVSADDPTSEAETSQRLGELERVLDQLPPHVAMALLLHTLAGRSIGEIASELGVAQITVKKYLAKALLHCRSTCEGESRDTL